MENCRYIKVILPLKLAWEPWYRTSEGDIRHGMRVTVPFAGKKYLAVIDGADDVPDVEPEKIKDIIKVERHLDDISDSELRLWKFISEYYLCTIGEVYRLAYPSVKNTGEQVVARAAERHEMMRLKTLDLYRKRLARLQERLQKKEQALAGRHNAKVTAELDADRKRLLNEILDVRRHMEELETERQAANPVVQEEVDVSDNKAGIPHNIVAGDILNAFADGRNVLLEGGSSRLDAIIQVASSTISEGRSVLMLVPEIALSRQLQERLEGIFGDTLMVFHSLESAGRRRDIAATLRQSTTPRLILGTRSSLFLPFNDLGLIIVEEEHDTAYKQDSAPRYIARDTAVMLGGIHDARVLLSSPTPSLESLYNCVTGRYIHILTDKDDGLMEIVDTSVEKKKSGMLGDLSRKLIRQVIETAGSGKKVLIMRPWGPMDDIKDELFNIIPELGGEDRIVFKTIHEAVRLDISSYRLVAVIGTDLMLDKSDFRADERTMQVLEQFRARFSGTMLIQTRQGGHPVFSHDAGYPLQLLAERKSFSYPPYSRMMDIVMHDNNERRLRKMSSMLSDALSEFNPTGPFTPAKGKTAENSTAVIRIMLPKDRTLTGKKKKIAGLVDDFEKAYKYTGHICIDVDPV